MAKLAGVELAKTALSHSAVPRPRLESPLLPDAAVRPLPDIPEDWRSPGAEADGGADSDGQQQGSEGGQEGGQQADAVAGDVGGGGGAGGGAPVANGTTAAPSAAANSAGAAVAAGDGGADSEEYGDLDADAPAVNATEAALIDFDDEHVGVGVVPTGSGFLARLSDSVTGALGSVFSA